MNVPYELSQRFDVSRETMDRLEMLVQGVIKWNKSINLVSKSTISEIWYRHILDSAQLMHAVDTPRHWVDLGSGGGFPGLVVAALMAQTSPDTKISLVESDSRKCAFLRAMHKDLTLNVTVHETRVEELEPQEADVLSARALSSLNELLEFVERHKRSGGVAIFLKGKTYQSELTEAEKDWHIEYDLLPSITDSSARILKIGNFRRVSE